MSSVSNANSWAAPTQRYPLGHREIAAQAEDRQRRREVFRFGPSERSLAERESRLGDVEASRHAEPPAVARDDRERVIGFHDRQIGLRFDDGVDRERLVAEVDGFVDRYRCAARQIEICRVDAMPSSQPEVAAETTHRRRRFEAEIILHVEIGSDACRPSRAACWIRGP